MLHRRMLIREMALSTSAVLAVLVAIALVVLFIRLLGDVARGELPNEAVFAFLGFSTLFSLPVILTIAVFSGILLTFARMWRDSEMVIWSGAGLPLTYWLRPVMRFALPMGLVLVVLVFAVNPWAQGKRNEFRDELQSRGDTSLVAPGMFAETGGGERVYYVQSLNPLTGVVRDVFMQTRTADAPSLVIAREGRYTQAEDGTRYIVFSQGRRYEGQPGRLDFRIVEFERYWMRLDPVAVEGRGLNLRQLSIAELRQEGSDRAQGELLWRVTLPISLVLLAALALPLSFMNARANRSYGFVIALLLFVVYYNLMSMTQAWVAQGKLDFWVALALPHVVMLAAVVIFFRMRMSLAPFAFVRRR